MRGIELDNINGAAMPVLRMSVVRVLLLYLAVFMAATSLFSVFVYWHSASTLFVQTDSTLVWEARYFASFSGDALAKEIDRQLARERPINFFGLFEADGSRVAGDIVELPDAAKDPVMSGATNLAIRLRNRSAPVRVRIIAQRREQGRILVIARDLSDVTALRSSILQGLLVGNGLVFVVTLFAGFMLAARQTQRINRVMDAVDRIARGNLHRRLADGGRDEFGRLTGLVDAMLDDIERLMQEVKGACDSIAHDLRTPLGRARLHLVQYLDETKHVAVESVECALTEVDVTLTRFAALLRLSEIEARALPERFCAVSLPSLVEKIGEILEPLAEEHDVSLNYELGQVPAVSGDEQLLFEAIYNLVENAVKFSRRGGTVTVRTVAGPTGPALVVRDSGPGIPASELSMIGTRFFRGRAAAGVPGSGLGLSLALAVARLHHCRLAFGDAGPGTEVRFEFHAEAMPLERA
jgi:signal transduction histidine kinase